MARITTFIPGTQCRHTVTSTSYGPADGSEGYFEWNPDKYDGIVAVYVEIVAYTDDTGCLPNALAGVSWELYDVTNTTQIGAWTDTGSSWEVRRSTDISASMPASTATMRISWKKVCGTSATASATRLIIVQENPTKTRAFISVGGCSYTNSTSYTTLGQDDKQWLWNASKFATIDEVHYHTTYKSDTAGRSATVKFDNLAETDSQYTASSTATSYHLDKSGDLSGTITNSSTYRTYFKISDSSAFCYIANGYLVVDLINLTKFVTNLDIMCEGFYDTASSYGAESPFIATYDNSTDFWDGVTKYIYHQACLYQSSATSADAILFDDGSQISDSEVSTSSSSMEIQKSIVLSDPADGSIIGYSIKQTSTGRPGQGISAYSVITFEVIVSAGTNMKINIEDSWKEVSSVKINIGDSWKEVTSMKINIGDSWKTIF